MQEGYLCTSADPRRAGGGGGETVILNPRELRKAITLQQTTKDQTIWMTTSQTGFPLERDVDEVTNIRDAQMGRTTARYLHPAISEFIAEWPQAAIDLENEWSHKNLDSPHRALTTISTLGP